MVASPEGKAYPFDGVFLDNTEGTLFAFRQNFTLEDAIESHMS
jgi:hypothetical protein